MINQVSLGAKCVHESNDVRKMGIQRQIIKHNTWMFLIILWRRQNHVLDILHYIFCKNRWRAKLLPLIRGNRVDHDNRFISEYAQLIMSEPEKEHQSSRAPSVNLHMINQSKLTRLRRQYVEPESQASVPHLTISAP
jgi:hypothetical protein